MRNYLILPLVLILCLVASGFDRPDMEPKAPDSKTSIQVFREFESDEVRAVAVDSSGNIFVTGYFTYDVDFDPGAGSDIVRSESQYDAFLLKLDPSGNYQWVQTWQSCDRQSGAGIAIDPFGNIFISGSFSFEADFDPGPGTDIHVGVGGSDIYVTKFDSSGNWKWARTWGGDRSDFCWAVDVDSNGNCYIGGEFTTEIDLDPGPGTDIRFATNWDTEAFICKLDQSGDLVWGGIIGGDGGESLKDIAVNNNGDVFFTGKFGNQADFDPGTGVHYIQANGRADAYLCKLDSSGNFQWVTGWGGTVRVRDDQGFAIALDPSGDIYVAGQIWYPAGLNVLGLFHIGAEAQSDAFLYKFDSSGTEQWNRIWGAGRNEYASDVCIGDNGQVITSGCFFGSVDFDLSFSRAIARSSGQVDTFLVSLDSSGGFLWLRDWGGRGWGDRPNCVTIGDAGNILVGGCFQGTVDFDPGSGTDQGLSEGENVVDGFLSMFDSSGVFQWVHTWGGRW